jgi:hypothetical protein
MITKERIIELMMDNFFNDPEAILPGVNVNDAADAMLAELEKEQQEMRCPYCGKPIEEVK